MAEKASKNAANLNKRKSVKDKNQTPKNDKSKDNNVFTEKHFNPNENFSKYLRDHKHKKGIVITSRVHPGESNSSFVAGNLLKLLINDTFI